MGLGAITEGKEGGKEREREREREIWHVRTQGKGIIWSQEESSHQQARKRALTKSAYTLILDFPASITVMNQCLLFEPPSLWYFVIAAPAKTREVLFELLLDFKNSLTTQSSYILHMDDEIIQIIRCSQVPCLNNWLVTSDWSTNSCSYFEQALNKQWRTNAYYKIII